MSLNTNQEIEKEFDVLKDQVIFLNFEWQQFESLFGKSEERVNEVLNATAENFFSCVQRVFADHFAISLYRLLDKRRDVSSITRFVGHLSTLNASDQMLPIEELLLKIEAIMPPIREWRSKIAAHQNKKVAFGIEMPGGYSRKSINQILIEIGRLLNHYSESVRDNHYVLDHIGNVHFGAEYLVVLLKKSILYDQAITEGRIDRHEYDRSPLVDL